jgi:hypothetical protein
MYICIILYSTGHEHVLYSLYCIQILKQHKSFNKIFLKNARNHLIIPPIPVHVNHDLDIV